MYAKFSPTRDPHHRGHRVRILVGKTRFSKLISAVLRSFWISTNQTTWKRTLQATSSWPYGSEAMLSKNLTGRWNFQFPFSHPIWTLTKTVPVNTFLESTISSKLKYHYLIMIGRKGEWRKWHFKRDPERRLDAYASAADPCRGAYDTRWHPPAPGRDPISVPPRHISYHWELVQEMC